MYSGPLEASICIVGEAPGAEEEREHKPFVGLSGKELTRMLGDAGLAREACLITNICNIRPPNNEIESFFHSKTEAKLLNQAPFRGRYPNEHIQRGILEANDLLKQSPRNIIIALGDTALWALTGLEGVTKWRGSILETIDTRTKVIPTFHPASVLRNWTQRPIAVQDLRRAAREARYPEIRKPEYHFIIRPDFTQVTFDLHNLLDQLPPITVDIETRDNQIACIGIAWNKTDALCIPFMKVADSGSYWSAEQELEIVLLLRDLLTRAPCIFHNALFDCQYIAKQWGFMPRIAGDTMLMQHVAYPALMGGKIDSTSGKTSKKGSSNSLVFIASMYCGYYRHWKDDGRLWDPREHPEEIYWTYNCEDCVRTYECWEALSTILQKSVLTDAYQFELGLFSPVFEMMFRGVNIDLTMRNKLHTQLNEEIDCLQAWLDSAIGHKFNPESAPQCHDLFYNDFKVQPVLNRKTKRPTLDDKALETIAKRTPLLVPLIERIQRIRTLRVIDSTFLQAPLSRDNRLRCAFNIASVETYRFSSNETAFGEGTNLTNVPKPVEE